MGISAGSQCKITNFPASNESAFGDLITSELDPVSGGTYIYNLTLSTNGNDIIDLIPYNIFVAPGETLTASVSGTASTAAGVSLNWIEEV